MSDGMVSLTELSSVASPWTEEDDKDTTQVKVQPTAKQWGQVPTAKPASLKELQKEEARADTTSTRPSELGSKNIYGGAKPTQGQGHYNNFEESDYSHRNTRERFPYRGQQPYRGASGMQETAQIPMRPPWRAYIGSLPPNINCEDLLNLFTDFPVLEVKIIARCNSFSTPFAYVEFRDEESLLHALEFNRREYNGFTLRVDVALSERANERRDGLGYRSNFSNPQQFSSFGGGTNYQRRFNPPAAVSEPAPAAGKPNSTSRPKQRENPFGAAKPSDVDTYRIQYSSNLVSETNPLSESGPGTEPVEGVGNDNEGGSADYTSNPSFIGKGTGEDAVGGVFCNESESKRLDLDGGSNRGTENEGHIGKSSFEEEKRALDDSSSKKGAILPGTNPFELLNENSA